MKLLTFQARRFAWQPYEQTLDEAPAAESGEAEEAVVVFFHAETKDQDDESRRRVFKHTLKHVKWLANKRDFKNVVLHSFTHLGGDNAEPAFAHRFATDLQERLDATGYRVSITPFGWMNAWQIDVLGDSLAKVWKEI